MEDRRRKTRKTDKMKMGLMSLVVTMMLAIMGWGAQSQSISNEITRELLKGQGVTNERLHNQINSFEEQKVQTREGFRLIHERMERNEKKWESMEKNQVLFKYRMDIYWPDTKHVD